MVCRNCNHSFEGTPEYCANCGAKIEYGYYATPVSVPENLTPLSPWAYFGLTLLFSVPIVGFIFLIIFSCNSDNINRRNFARSYWCSLVIFAVAIVILVAVFGSGALATVMMSSQSM